MTFETLSIILAFTGFFVALLIVWALSKNGLKEGYPRTALAFLGTLLANALVQFYVYYNPLTKEVFRKVPIFCLYITGIIFAYEIFKRSQMKHDKDKKPKKGEQNSQSLVEVGIVLTQANDLITDFNGTTLPTPIQAMQFVDSYPEYHIELNDYNQTVLCRTKDSGDSSHSILATDSAGQNQYFQAEAPFVGGRPPVK